MSLCEPKANEGVGFKDLNAFNPAILAKQAWCLIHCHHFLLYRVLPYMLFLEGKHEE